MRYTKNICGNVNWKCLNIVELFKIRNALEDHKEFLKNFSKSKELTDDDCHYIFGESACVESKLKSINMFIEKRKKYLRRNMGV